MPATIAWPARIARAGPSKVAKEAVAGRVALLAAEAGELATHNSVVLREQVAPCSVAERRRSPG